MRMPVISAALTILLAACVQSQQPVDSSSDTSVTTSTSSSTSISVSNPSQDPVTGFAYPLPNAKERMTKKFFGTFVTPENSPVQPERFTGFHTGTDFETFPSEQNATVTAMAICDGTVLYQGWVSGYGGVMVQSCTYENQPVTVLYGHLNVDTMTMKKGDDVTTGRAIGNLGKGYSHETDGERKHLHVSVHKGSSIDFKGYVSSSAQLNQWIDAYPRQ